MARNAKNRWRSATSYLSTDPEKREKQLGNLVAGGKKKGVKHCSTIQREVDEALQRCNVIEFAEQFLGVEFDGREAQRATLKSVYGLPLNRAERKLYEKLCNGAARYREGVECHTACLVWGARSGKSFVSAIIMLFELLCKAEQWKKSLGKGEAFYAICIAAREQQAIQVMQENCVRLLENAPKLSGWIEQANKGELRLKNGAVVLALPCTSKAARGLPIVVATLDESAFFMSEGVNQDRSVLDSTKRGMVQFNHGVPKVLIVSTPAGRQGLLYETFKRGYRNRVRGLFVSRAASWVVNERLSKKFLREEKQRDADSFSREYQAKFAQRVSSYFASCSNELKACFTLADDQPFDPAHEYLVAVDPSGLRSRDTFGIAVGHVTHEGEIEVDFVRSVDARGVGVVHEVAEIAMRYQCSTVLSDAFSFGYVASILEGYEIETVKRTNLAQCFASVKRHVLAGTLRMPQDELLEQGMQATVATYGKNNSMSVSRERDSFGHGDSADATASLVHALTGMAGQYEDWYATFEGAEEIAAEREAPERTFVKREVIDIASIMARQDR